MNKTLYSILALFMALATLNSCSSEDSNIISPDYMEDPTQQLLKQTYSLFGLKKDDCKDFMGFPGIITKENALALTAIKQANSKLVFAVYDSIKSKVVICDSSYVIPSQIQETYYDEKRNYEVCGLKPSILRTKNGFAGVASVLYKHTPLLEEKYHVKETEEGKFALELDGYIKKLIWRKWDTTYLEERMKHTPPSLVKLARQLSGLVMGFASLTPSSARHA